MKNSLLLSLALMTAMPVAAAKLSMPSDAPKSYESECASCHMAYQPGLLGQKNWLNIMADLGKHFGSDASLDDKTQSEISKWLIKNASSDRKYSALAPENRITKSAWFIKEHAEVKAEVWTRPSVKSSANCTACHTDAATGNFSERKIRIPVK